MTRRILDRHWPIAVPVAIVIGLALSFGGIFLASSAAAGGHGTYMPAKMLFPWSMLVAEGCRRICNVAIALALMQFPFYLLIAALPLTSRTKIVAAIVILSAHAACSALLFRFAFWVPN